MQPKTNQTYVIGHVNPDADSIASAVGYSWLLRERDGEHATAARAGQLNPQTIWILNRLGLEPPILVSDASPRFLAITHRMNPTPPDRPLREAWKVANRTGGVAPIVAQDGSPYGLITGPSLFEFLARSLGTHARREEIQLGEILDLPCKEACDTDVPSFQENTRIRDVLPQILREERSEFWVVNEAGRYVGVCRQREALNPPRLRLILVDHNEAGQAIRALNEADLIEIVDHHRLGNPTTHRPIRFTVDVVGSTSTLVSERIAEAGLSAPPDISGLLLAGLISDTLLLASPTTTQRDHEAAERLGRWALMYGSPLAGETVKSFGDQILQAGTGLSARDPEAIIHADLKTYESAGMRFAISQAEVANLERFKEFIEPLRAALIKLRDSEGLDFAMLMVTDVVRKTSRLLLTDPIPILDQLPYPRLDDSTLLAEDVVSRKMQLLPVVFSTIEG